MFSGMRPTTVVLTLLAGGFVVACGSTAAPGSAGEADASLEAGPSVDASDAAAEAPFETRGAYRCCAEGTGTDCCRGLPERTCDRYGGLYGQCLAQGEVFEGKILCATCCDGLEHTTPLVPGDAYPPEVDQLEDGCDFGPEPPSVVVCIRCGDGVCGAGENSCNCAKDCPRPPTLARRD